MIIQEKNLTEKEKKLIELYRSCDEKGKWKIYDEAETVAFQQELEREKRKNIIDFSQFRAYQN